METPLSTRRITRSLAAAAAAAASSAQKSAANSAAHFTRPKNAAAGERAALHDITNDSPIVGLAAGGLHDKTPGSTATKTRPRPRRTPGSGSGEALLRGQVKALLHKVHEEQGSATAAALARPPARIQALLGVRRSPAQLLAPTPANTPQLGVVSAAREGLLLPDGSTVMPCVLAEEDPLIPELQVIAASLPPSSVEENLSEGQLHRALVFDDSPEKSDSSSLKFHDGRNTDKPSTEDDSSSTWSLQVHASSEKGDDEEVGEELTPKGGYTEEEEEEEDWEEGSDDGCFDDLCDEMSKMTVFDEEEEKAGLPQFEGKHTRFIYNSDDEIEMEEVVPSAEARAELDALLLRGLPVPKGRHLRFHEDDDEDEE